MVFCMVLVISFRDGIKYNDFVNKIKSFSDLQKNIKLALRFSIGL